ncbi:MAG: hypothetical protein ABJP48_08430 [Erythrobacter sp.]
MKRLVVSFAVSALLAISHSARAEDAQCYDVKVRAKAVSQIPTVLPDQPGFIVLTWPWFVDLRIRRVIDGELDANEVTALAVLHSEYTEKHRIFLLRRNTLGGFNILGPEEPDEVPKCEIEIGPARPYILADSAETLEDYRRAGEEAWIRHWDDEEDE